MNHLRKAAALAAAGALCLFAACGRLSLTPAAPTASPQPDTDAAAQARGGTLRERARRLTPTARPEA